MADVPFKLPCFPGRICSFVKDVPLPSVIGITCGRRCCTGVRRGLGEYGTYVSVKARFWPWLSGKLPQTFSNCSLFARQGS